MSLLQQVSQRRCCAQTFKGPNVRSATVLAPVTSRRTLTIRAAVAAVPVEVSVKTVEGEVVGAKKVSLSVAKPETAKALVHRYLILVQQNKRQGTASTLTRTEVRGGGKKPYKQKGTGNARRGSNTSPLFPGGGVSFGPKPKDWSIKMNRKEKKLAMATAVQSAAADMVVVEDLKEKITEKKTKTLVSVLEKLGVDTQRRCLLVLKEPLENVMLSGRNLEKLTITTTNSLNVFDILHADKIVVESAALEHIQSHYGAAA